MWAVLEHMVVDAMNRRSGVCKAKALFFLI